MWEASFLGLGLYCSKRCLPPPLHSAPSAPCTPPPDICRQQIVVQPAVATQPWIRVGGRHTGVALRKPTVTLQRWGHGEGGAKHRQA